MIKETLKGLNIHKIKNTERQGFLNECFGKFNEINELSSLIEERVNELIDPVYLHQPNQQPDLEGDLDQDQTCEELGEQIDFKSDVRFLSDSPIKSA